MRFLIVVFVLLVYAMALPAQTPIFQDDFSNGKLDTSKWVVVEKEGIAGSLPGKNWGAYRAEYVQVFPGVVRFAMTQELQPSGKVISLGSEIESVDAYGYGTYTFVMRMSSTADQPDASGQAVSGSVSAGWNYLPGSETEIDIEFRGDIPDTIRCTNFVNRRPENIRFAEKTTTVVSADPAGGFHTYSFVWSPGSIVWYMDGARIAENRSNVPSKPARIRVNHWGSNSAGFGGLATPGVARYVYLKSVTFQPLETR